MDRAEIRTAMNKFIDSFFMKSQERQPGFLFGEGYMVDTEGDRTYIGHDKGKLRPMVMDTRMPVVPQRQTNPIMGYKQRRLNAADEKMPITTSDVMSKDVMPAVKGDYWDKFQKESPNMSAEKGEDAVKLLTPMENKIADLLLAEEEFKKDDPFTEGMKSLSAKERDELFARLLANEKRKAKPPIYSDSKTLAQNLKTKTASGGQRMVPAQRLDDLNTIFSVIERVPPGTTDKNAINIFKKENEPEMRAVLSQRKRM